MKKIILFFILSLVINLTYAQKQFIGDWYVIDPRDKIYNTTVIENNHTTTSFNVLDNQLYLKCKNKYHGDTLLLYVSYIDCGRLFEPGSEYHLPKINSLFAKCYIHDKMLHIIYTQKFFKDNIDEFKLNTVLRRE